MAQAVLLDSGFLIRLMNPDEPPRVVVPNDTKMFAQASTETDILSFVSADSEARKVYDLLENPDFGFIDIRKDTPNLTGGSR